MIVLAIDPATVTGFAIGEAGTVPRSGSARLRRPGEARVVATHNMRCLLRDLTAFDKPDVVVCEDFLNPAAHKSADAAILGIALFTIVEAWAFERKYRFEAANRSTVLKHFIGVGRTGDRASTKDAVIRRARLLKYIPSDCHDDNRADAAALFDYGSVTFARRSPAALTMFGEGV